MNTYKIVFDASKSMFDALPTVEAKSPKDAAEKYAGCKMKRHIANQGGEIVVQTTTFPHKMFLYDRIKSGG
jgi:hypothetical protein